MRGYDLPARYLNYFNWRASQGRCRRGRAITLLPVPVLYSIFVLDLKLVKWEAAGAQATQGATETPAVAGMAEARP
ncbi:MAG TPA: hypothetical protein VE642_07325 [Pyrinomonadaceae bacterium]|nr:hypothetical protein [Pyrinomonadaceae bacterium]